MNFPKTSLSFAFFFYFWVGYHQQAIGIQRDRSGGPIYGSQSGSIIHLIPGKNIATLTAYSSRKIRVLAEFSNNFLRGSVTREIYLLGEIIQITFCFRDIELNPL